MAAKKTSKKKAVKIINKSLEPFEKSLDFVKDIAKKGKEQFPWVYDHLEETLGQHIVSIDKDNISEMGDVLKQHLIQKLPNIPEDQLKHVLEKPDEHNFLDTLTKGLGINPAAQKNYSVIKKGRLFKRVLIANRGEIALRIIRACRELEVETVAIYSEHEEDALPVKFATKSVNIGASKNYLDIKKIVSAAKKAGADAIHPGYGFLSENSEFAKLCEKNNIKFIGPKSLSIALLGDKVTAKQKMREYHVPVIEGLADPLESKEQAKEVSDSIGYPVILKAKSGGGGKGMRIVRKSEEVMSFFESASSEALNAFGDGDMYVEKYVEDPKHIEFQILADQHGNVIHLGERDCSIQRRHQKLIEEAPSPSINHELRTEMGTAAVNAIKAIGYEGAGTVEFLLDKQNNFYFIEMNTRIQVEHGITELITGVDLVKEQIKLAAGATLAFQQEDIKVEGWAMECRINAEDPYEEFAPSTGTVINYLPPGGTGIKLSSPCFTGYVVSPHFDSLLGLLMCKGKDRDEVIQRMDRALSEYVIEGVQTTIPFHLSILNNKTFQKGNVTTSFIEREQVIAKLKKSQKKEKKNLSGNREVLLISTAVSQYKQRKKQQQALHSSWSQAAKQDTFNDAL